MTVSAEDSAQAGAWFDGLEQTVMSLNKHPARGASILEDRELRQLLYGRKGNSYRVIYRIDDLNHVVTVLHIRHGSRAALVPNQSDEDA